MALHVHVSSKIVELTLLFFYTDTKTFIILLYFIDCFIVLVAVYVLTVYFEIPT